jgi:hypothetical protein
MKKRASCRLQLEELEQRAVPALLTGTHPINLSFTGQLVAVNVLQGGSTGGSGQVTANLTLKGALLNGATLSFSGQVTGHPTPTVFDVAGTLTVKSRLGMVDTTNNTGTVDITNVKTTGMGTFTDTGTISGGTRFFRAAGGSFSMNGTFSALTESASGTITGVIFGSHGHHGHGHHHHPHHHR